MKVQHLHRLPPNHAGVYVAVVSQPARNHLVNPMQPCGGDDDDGNFQSTGRGNYLPLPFGITRRRPRPEHFPKPAIKNGRGAEKVREANVVLASTNILYAGRGRPVLPTCLLCTSSSV